MRMVRIGLVAAGCLSAPALAQVQQPKFYVWSFRTPQEVLLSNGCVALRSRSRATSMKAREKSSAAWGPILLSERRVRGTEVSFPCH